MVKVVILCLSPVVFLESFYIPPSASCLFGGSASSDSMAFFYCYPTDFAIDCDSGSFFVRCGEVCFEVILCFVHCLFLPPKFVVVAEYDCL